MDGPSLRLSVAASGSSSKAVGSAQTLRYIATDAGSRLWSLDSTPEGTSPPANHVEA